MSKEGGESSLVYGTSDGTSRASPESSVRTAGESACEKAGKPGRARLPQPQLPGRSRGCAASVSGICQQARGLLEDFQVPSFSPSLGRWDHPSMLFFGRTKDFQRTVRKMVCLDSLWVPVLPPPHQPGTSLSVAGGQPGGIGWEPAGASSYHAWTSAALGLARDTTPVPW